MRPKTFSHLFALTFLIGATLLNSGEVSGQGVQRLPQPPPPVMPLPVPLPQPQPFPTLNRVIIDPPHPLSTPFVITPQSPAGVAPQAARPTSALEAAPLAPRSAGEPATSGTPPPDTGTSDPDGGSETPTPDPSPSATPPRIVIPTPTPDDAGSASHAYTTPSPTPTPSPSPLTNYATPADSTGSWWPWLIALVGVVLFVKWVSRRRSRGY